MSTTAMDSAFDIRLIKEFEKVPAFYNRSDPCFKNKTYINQMWENIALTLGFKSNLLRDRMLQLRNRFNLEKRKMEQMRENGANPISSWPLFEYMTFLEGHIRPRKSYKMMMKEIMHRQYNENGDTRGGYDSDDRTHSDDDNPLVYGDNGKHEQFSDDQPSIDGSNVAQFMVPEMTESMSASGLPPPPPMKRQRMNEESMWGQNQYGQFQTEMFPKMDKYNKFGQFIASSLADLPEDQALSLIEKFTVDIVASLKNNLSN